MHEYFQITGLSLNWTSAPVSSLLPPKTVFLSLYLFWPSSTSLIVSRFTLATSLLGWCAALILMQIEKFQFSLNRFGHFYTLFAGTTLLAFSWSVLSCLCTIKSRTARLWIMRFSRLSIKVGFCSRGTLSCFSLRCWILF